MAELAYWVGQETLVSEQHVFTRVMSQVQEGQKSDHNCPMY